MTKKKQPPLYHNYSPDTGEYLSSARSDASPKEKDVYLIPAYATLIPLPERGDNEIAVFQNDSWAIVPDYRGQNIERLNEIITIAEIGKTPDDFNPTQDEIEAYDHESLKQKNDEKRRDFLGKLHDIDMKSIRALRANDTDRLLELESEAIKIRTKLQEIE